MNLLLNSMTISMKIQFMKFQKADLKKETITIVRMRCSLPILLSLIQGHYLRKYLMST